MKLLVVSTNADLAGAPIHVKEIVLALIADGHDVMVAFGSDGLIKSALEFAGVKTCLIDGMRSSIRPFHDLRSYIKLLRVAKAFKPDMIHCHSAKAGMLSRLVAFKLGLPCIYTVHGWGFGPGRRRVVSIPLKIIERLLVPLTTQYVSVSDADRVVGEVELRIPANKITTIRNGVSYDVSEASLRPRAPIVVMVARNEYPKDYRTLTLALKLSSVEKALFVGYGTEERKFIDSCQAVLNNNTKNIEYLGIRDDVSYLLENSSIFVLSSRHEALPLSIIEAMSKGLPIIASDVGGVRELVAHNINGFLFEPGDYLALSRYIDRLASDLELRLRMGNESLRRYRANYTADRMMANLAFVYSTCLAKFKS